MKIHCKNKIYIFAKLLSFDEKDTTITDKKTINNVETILPI